MADVSASSPRSTVGTSIVLALLGGLLCGACRSERTFSSSRLGTAAEATGTPFGHQGPAVAPGENRGPDRFVRPLYTEFDETRAMETVAFADRFYREPASDGYEATTDYVLEALREVGFGKRPELALRVVERDMVKPAWTPLSASITLIGPDGRGELLHGFTDESGRDRCMLPRNAPSASLEGPVALHLDEVRPGSILVMQAKLRPDLLLRAKKAGALAVFSSFLQTFNEDPTGAERHLDAIQYRNFKGPICVPIAQISPRSYARIEKEIEEHGSAQIAYEADVRFDLRPVRTIIAEIVGRDRPHEAIAVSSHIQEPGACDNASGIASLLESVASLVRLIDRGELEWPSRTLAFLWGDEFGQSEVWLEESQRQTIVGLSSDMTGQDRIRTGAIALLERMPDPGAVSVLEPDAHTPWGAGDVDEEELVPNGLAVVARCAMADVNAMAGGTWVTREHPWEGGSDHDVFIAEGIPSALFWHFTDYAYHTSLDRVENVDAGEMRRTACALLGTALAMADPRPSDFERYAESLAIEEELRVAAALAEEEEDTAVLWSVWCRGAESWLREQCLGLDP